MEHAEEDILVAEIADEWLDERIRIGTPLQPRQAAFALAAVAVSVMFIALVMQNLVFDSVEESPGSTGDYERVPVWERANWPYITDAPHGFVMEYGPYNPTATDNEWNSTHQFVEFTLPLAEGGAAPDGLVSLAYWLPDVPEGSQVPMIAEFGP